jgi:Tfp pilus assembly protein PilN
VGLLQAARHSSAVSIDFLKRSLAKAPGVQRAAVTTLKELAAVLSTPRGILSVVGPSAGVLAVFWLASTLMVAAAARQLDQVRRGKPELSLGLDQLTQEKLDEIKTKTTTQATLLRQLKIQRVSVAAKLDALARSLPDGVWLTGLTFQDEMTSSGKSQSSLVVNGACFLGEAGREIDAIEQFKEQIKRNPQFFNGFSAAQVGQINTQVGQPQQQTYQTFLLNCNS